MTSPLNVLKSVSAISIAALSLIAIPQAQGADEGATQEGIALLNIDARVMGDDTRPGIALLNMDGRVSGDVRPGIALLNMDGRVMADDSNSGIALLNLDARSMGDTTRPSIALLNMDGRVMDGDTRPSIALLNMDGRSMADDDTGIALLNLDARVMADDICTIDVNITSDVELAQGLFVEGGDLCRGERAYIPASAFEDGFATVRLSPESTLGAQVTEVIMGEGFDLAEVDMESILGASLRVTLGGKDSLDVALNAVDLGLFRHDNGVCGADPTGTQGLADAICRSL